MCDRFRIEKCTKLRELLLYQTNSPKEIVITSVQFTKNIFSR